MVPGWKLRDTAAAFFGALLLCVTIPAHAQSTAEPTRITNTADAQWRFGGARQTVTSNEVAFDVEPNPVDITAYLPSTSGAISLPVPSAMCGGQTLPPVISGNSGNDQSVNLEQTNSLRIGQTLVFRVIVPRANRDPSAINSILTVLKTPSGDEEHLTIYETGANTGEFAAAIATVRMPPAPVSGDCRLSLTAGENISIEYRANNDVTVLASTSLDVLADPAGFVFDTQTGDVVDGARITIVDNATGQPAPVYAEDGVTRWPSSMVSGHSVTDAAGNTHPMMPGEFRFPLMYAGDYRLVVEPPQPYTAPSITPMAELAGYTRPTGDPYILIDASYGKLLHFAATHDVFLDIPLDRPLIQTSITKTVSKDTAVPGDVVLYTVTVSNPDTIGRKRNVVVTDTPSQWLRLRQDTVRVDGEAAPDVVSVSADGRELSISFDEIAAGASHRITYAMTVRADAPEGDAQNRAIAVDLPRQIIGRQRKCED